MSLEYVANEDLKVKFTNSAGPPDLLYTGDKGIDLTEVVPTLSTHCKANSKKVATTLITVVWTSLGCPFTSVTHTFIAGAALVQTSALKTKADGFIVLREGDSSLLGCIGSWTPPSTPPLSIPCACSVEISDAGQTKAKAQ